MKRRRDNHCSRDAYWISGGKAGRGGEAAEGKLREEGTGMKG